MALGKTIAHFGPAGSGRAAKAANQVMCAGIIDTIGGAMAFAHAQGLPLTQLVIPSAREASSASIS